MAEFSFEEAAAPAAPVPPPAPMAETPKAFSFEDALKPPESAPAENLRPMPGMAEALSQGVSAGVSDVGQTVTSFSSVAPQPIKEESPAASSFSWEDALSPVGKGLPKVAYRLGKSSPTLGLG